MQTGGHALPLKWCIGTVAAIGTLVATLLSPITCYKLFIAQQPIHYSGFICNYMRTFPLSTLTNLAGGMALVWRFGQMSSDHYYNKFTVVSHERAPTHERVPTPYFWHNFLYMVKVYLSERPPWTNIRWSLRSTVSNTMRIWGKNLRAILYQRLLQATFA